MRFTFATLLLLATIAPSLHALRWGNPKVATIVDKPLTERSLDIKDYRPGDAYQAMVSFASNFTPDMLHFTSDQRKAEFYEKLEKWNALVNSTQAYIQENGTPEEKSSIKKLDVISAKFFDSIERLGSNGTKVIDQRVLEQDVEKWEDYLSDAKQIFISLIVGLPLSKKGKADLKYKKVTAIIPKFDRVISAYDAYKITGGQTVDQFISTLLDLSKAQTVEKLVENLEKAAYLTKSEENKKSILEMIRIVRAAKLPGLNPSDTTKISEASTAQENKSRLVLIGIAFSLQIALENALKAAPDLRALKAKAKLKEGTTKVQEALERLKKAAQKAKN